jgi:hypothetical protein
MYFCVDTGEARWRHEALLQEADAARLARQAVRHRRALRRLEIAQHHCPSSDKYPDLRARLAATIQRVFGLVERRAPIGD